MVRMRFVLILLALAALALAPSRAGADGPTLIGVVGPDATISFRNADGRPVTHVEAGVAYTIEIDDRAEIHDFQLRGPGVQEHTTDPFVGHATWTVTFRDGYYRFFCAPHAADMRGQFTAGTPPPVTLAATVRETAIALTGTDGSAVQQLDPGAYSIAVDDTTTRENFYLAGPGLTEHTENHVAVRENWTVTLQNGVYHYFSERSAARLHGSFTVGTPPPPATEKALTAITGPDFSLTLLGPDFSPVVSLDPGTYTIAVDDRSSEHNFHLTGPGVNRRTSLDFTGVDTWTVTLRSGLYSAICDPHIQTMGVIFAVSGGSPPVRRLIATVGPGARISLSSPSVRAGTYRLTIRDRSARDNFHLTGPGVNARTGVAFRGTVTVTVRLRRGGYLYRSDASPRLRGELRVT